MNNNDYEKDVTIIIPSRNIDYLLEECIEKIRELYKEIKIILILDEINKEIDSNITILKSKSLNMSAKRNQGVEVAQTKYIAFLDSDSYSIAGWLENGVDFLENNENYSTVTGCQFNPPSDTFEQKCLRLVRFSRLFTHAEWCIVIDRNAKERDCNEFMTSNAIMKKQDYIDIGGMNEKIYLAEDNEFSQRLTENGYKIRFIPQFSVYHRESKMYPFLRKIYCMSYYYANTFVKGHPVKTIKQTIFQLLPLFGIITFIFLSILLKFSPYLLILPIFALLLLALEANKESKKLDEQRTKGFFIIFFTFCMFCAIWVIGSFLGLINFPSKNIQKCYKHY